MQRIAKVGQYWWKYADGFYQQKFKESDCKCTEKLQELSSNQELSLEEKMKKRQEIQQEISSLTQQLRQHQIELRKQQQNKSSNSVDELTGADYDDTEK